LNTRSQLARRVICLDISLKLSPWLCRGSASSPFFEFCPPDHQKNKFFSNNFPQVARLVLPPPHAWTDPVALLTTKTHPNSPYETQEVRSFRASSSAGTTNSSHVTRDLCIRTLEMTSPQENANGVNGTAKLADPQKSAGYPSTPAAVNGKPAADARNTTARINGHVIDPVASMENAGIASGVIRPNSASSLPAAPPASASQADTMMEQITPTEAQNDQGSSAEQDDKTAQGEDGKRDLYVGNLYVTLYHL